MPLLIDTVEKVGLTVAGQKFSAIQCVKQFLAEGDIWTLVRSAGEAVATPDNASMMKVPTLAVSAQNSNLRRFGVFNTIDPIRTSPVADKWAPTHGRQLPSLPYRRVRKGLCS